MRTRDELLRAHALTVDALVGRVPIGLSDDERAALAACADVLCWVLGHDLDCTFGDELARLERHARTLEQVLRRLPLN